MKDVSETILKSELAPDINSYIVKLYQASRINSHNEFKKISFQFLLEMVKFDVCSWSVFDGRDLHYKHQIYNFVNLGKTEYIYIVEAFEKLKSSAMRYLSKSSFWESVKDDDSELSKKGNIECLIFSNSPNVIHIGIPDLSRKFINLISLYRVDCELPFIMPELKFIQTYLLHLIEANHNNLHLEFATKSYQDNSCLCDRNGHVYIFGHKFVEMIKREGLESPFLRIPQKVIQPLGQMPNGVYIGEAVIILLTAINDLIQIRICLDRRDPRLTDRERWISKMLIAGNSYKHIAKDLDISVSTVTNHANNIYRKLGVTDKHSLAQQLRG